MQATCIKIWWSGSVVFEICLRIDRETNSYPDIPTETLTIILRTSIGGGGGGGERNYKKTPQEYQKMTVWKTNLNKKKNQ